MCAFWDRDRSSERTKRSRDIYIALCRKPARLRSEIETSNRLVLLSHRTVLETIHIHHVCCNRQYLKYSSLQRMVWQVSIAQPVFSVVHALPLARPLIKQQRASIDRFSILVMWGRYACKVGNGAMRTLHNPSNKQSSVTFVVASSPLIASVVWAAVCVAPSSHKRDKTFSTYSLWFNS